MKYLKKLAPFFGSETIFDDPGYKNQLFIKINVQKFKISYLIVAKMESEQIICWSISYITSFGHLKFGQKMWVSKFSNKLSKSQFILSS